MVVLIVVLAVVSASQTTLRMARLIPRAAESAAAWDQTDREIRAAKAMGVLDQTVPALNDVESRFGGPINELHIERDPLTYKNKCVARFYGLRSIRAQ